MRLIAITIFLFLGMILIVDTAQAALQNATIFLEGFADLNSWNNPQTEFVATANCGIGGSGDNCARSNRANQAPGAWLWNLSTDSITNFSVVNVTFWTSASS